MRIRRLMHDPHIPPRSLNIVLRICRRRRWEVELCVRICPSTVGVGGRRVRTMLSLSLSLGDESGFAGGEGGVRHRDRGEVGEVARSVMIIEATAVTLERLFEPARWGTSCPMKIAIGGGRICFGQGLAHYSGRGYGAV